MEGPVNVRGDIFPPLFNDNSIALLLSRYGKVGSLFRLSFAWVITKLNRRPVGKVGTVVSLWGERSRIVVVDNDEGYGCDTSTGEDNEDDTLLLLLPRILCAYSANDCTLRPDRRLLLSSNICPTAIGPTVNTLFGLDNDDDERLLCE